MQEPVATMSSDHVNVQRRFSVKAAVLLLLSSLSSTLVTPVHSEYLTTCETSVGDLKVGVDSYYDETCLGDGGGNVVGCYQNFCRFCKTKITQQSEDFVNCPWIGDDPNGPTHDDGAIEEESKKDGFLGNDGGGTPPNGGGSGNVLFYDDFSTFNLRTWKHEITMAGGGNWEFQIYRNNRTNSFVENGILHLKPTLSSDWNPDLGPWELYGLTEESKCTSDAFYGCKRHKVNPISSAKIFTRDFTFSKGRLEVRAKLPKGDWLWPAIWLLPKYETYGMWPVSGEIDVMEATGNAKGYADNRGVDSMVSVLHWGLDYLNNKFQLTKGSYTLPSGELSDDYHIFGLVRTDTGIYTYVDDDSNRVLEVDWSQGSPSFFERGGWDANVYTNPWAGASNGAPFADEEFYIVMNLAVGGISFFPDGQGNKPWTNDSPDASGDFWNAKDQWYPTWQHPNDPQFKIDWIRVTEN